MGKNALAALLLFLALALQHADTPHSDAAFRTFLSVSEVDNTITARLTYLDITYFHQVDEDEVAKIDQQVRDGGIGNLHQQGTYSTDSFTAKVLPAEGVPLSFTFEGMGIVGCDDIKTDADGKASCIVAGYKDSSGNEHGIEDYRSCGYVTVESGEAQVDGNLLPSATQTAVLCPSGSPALSAFGPAIYTVISSPDKLPFCFPVMLIAGLLVAAMYYSGRDPLSLFDITTPKLPKTQTFRVRTQPAPQMLRQVQRRYIMIKKQSRRSAMREIARLAKASGKDAREAKKKMNALYDKMEAVMKKGKLDEISEKAIWENWKSLMDEYRHPDSKKFERSLEYTSGILNAYLQAHHAWKSMGEARGKTSKGGLWTRKVTTPLVDKLTNASIALEGSKAGKVLGKIPFVNKVISAPTKMLDVALQWRGSRASLKAIRGEMLGQVATMLGHTKVGRPVYNAFKKAHVGADGKSTKFGAAYTALTGRSFKAFEEKHDLAKKRLVEYYKVVGSVRQHVIDAHNRMFDEIATNLLQSTPIRANAAKAVADALGIVDPKQLERMARVNGLDSLFKKIHGGMVDERGNERMRGGKEVARRLEALLRVDAKELSTDQLTALTRRIDALARFGDKETAKKLAEQLSRSIEYEQKLGVLLKDSMSGKHIQHELLTEMLRIAERSGKTDHDFVKNTESIINDFRKAELVLRRNLIVHLENNYYQAVDKAHLKAYIMDTKPGHEREELAKKYGANIEALVNNPELYRNLVAVRAAANGGELRNAIDSLKAMLPAGADTRQLDMLLGIYGKKKAFSDKDVASLMSRLNGMAFLKEAEEKAFASFDAKKKEMKTWVLEGKQNGMLNLYRELAVSLNKKVEGLGGNDIAALAREGCAWGKNPLELVLQKALEETIRDKAKLAKMDEEATNALIKQMNGMIKDAKLEIKDMDSLEQFFKKKAGGKANEREFLYLLGRLTKPGEKQLTPEDLMHGTLTRALEFQREWSARNYAAISILHGDKEAGKYMVSFSAALKEITSSGMIKAHLGYLGGEKEFYRKEMGYADYSRTGLEGSIYTARMWEKLSGFIVSKDWGGTSRGEQVLHLLRAAREDYRSTLARYNVLYSNLTNNESVFYDKAFADKQAGRAFDADAYDDLIKRGYTWQDKKNGLELLLSVDRKSTPMLEYDKKYMKQDEGTIVRKAEFNGGRADIRDYAPLVARTMGSVYSTREVGFVVLKRDTFIDKNGEEKTRWIYANPFKAENVSEKVGEAERQVTLRKDIMERLVAMKGLMENNQYNPNNAPIRVISVKDFHTYAKKKEYQNFFGTGAVDRFREGIRSIGYKPGMLFAEFAYGAYNDRMDKMQQWYAAQYQMRQALDRLQHTMQDKIIDEERGTRGMMAGKERFQYSDDFLNKIYSVSAPAASNDVHGSLQKEMKKLAAGADAGFADSAKAWWYNFRGKVASGIIGELGSAETDYYNARLAVRALDSLAAKHKIGGDEYESLRGDLLAAKDSMRSDYKKARDEFAGLNKDIISWTGSGGFYTPQRTMWNLAAWNFGLVTKMLDSHYVQGAKDEFYQITESSVMRDPRVAIGATSPGWDYSYYVGYHTGQNVYERARFWATNSMWERQMWFKTDLAYTVHKWWNDKMSFFARYTSGYPATVQSDMMTPPHYTNKSTTDYFKALLFIVPFQAKSYTDYFKARRQDAITFTGLGAMLAAYQSTGGAERYDVKERSWVRRALDKFGMESPHYWGTPYRIASQQRYTDQIMNFEDYVDRNGSKIDVNVEGEGRMNLIEARRGLDEAIARMDTVEQEKYKQGISDAVGGIAKLEDKRGRYIREVFSGSDIQEDGSKNRFLDMYAVFHSNVFSPTIPGMLQQSPIGKQEWYAFPQVARLVDDAADKTRLGEMKHYWQAGLGEDGRIVMSDKFTTRQDAVAEAYRNDTPVLMHLMHMQAREIQYTLLNAPSLAYINPIWFGLGRKVYKTLLHNTPGLETLSSTSESPDWTPGLVKQGMQMWERSAQARERAQAIKRGEEVPQKEEDYRRVIYGARAKAVVEEAEKSNDFFRWMRDGVYGWVEDNVKISAAPGDQIGSKAWRKERDSTLGKGR